MRVAWNGKFLRFDPARFGLIRPPAIAGSILFASQPHAGWRGPVQYRGLRQHGRRVVLEYDVHRTPIAESPWAVAAAHGVRITRTIEAGPASQPLVGVLFRGPGRIQIGSVNGLRFARQMLPDGRVLGVALTGAPAARLTASPGVDAEIRLTIPPSRTLRQLQLQYWAGPADQWRSFLAAAAQPLPQDIADLKELRRPSDRLWQQTITTRGRRGSTSAGFAVDTLSLPFENPYKALLFVSGHDFFRNGDAALCTVHGDVWRVSGIDDSLRRLTWQRIATGLFQPLGLRIVDDQVYVLGRDQITRLIDRNADGETDHYVCFTNRYYTSAGGHDYVTCLETDAQGSFYFLHARDGLLKVSPDGRKMEVIASGFRNPNGLSVGPRGAVTVSPQEGNWTPASNIALVRRGGYYGYGGPRTSRERPAGYDPPLCWIPRRLDNSSGGQVWIDSTHWGSLQGRLLHLSFGQCRALLTLTERAQGVAQGGVMSLPWQFESGVMRARFRPHDGQLYVSGMNGWVSSAVRDGCFQRVRRVADQPLLLPVGVATMRNGVRLTFSQTLDQTFVENPGNYRVQQWNYRYSENYGSEEYRPSAPRQPGRDELEVLSATRLQDRRSLFLELPDLKPVHQMAIQFAVRSEQGRELSSTYYHTVHSVGRKAMNASQLVRSARPGRLPDELRSRLRGGLALRFRSPGAKRWRDARVARLAAMRVEPGQPSASRVAPGPLEARWEGYLRRGVRETLRFHFEGRGTATLKINGKRVLHEDGFLTGRASPPVTLHQGHNRFQLDYSADSQEVAGGSGMRLLWSSARFAREPVPPTAFEHDSHDAQLRTAQRWRQGRTLYRQHHCGRCHLGEKSAALTANEAPQLHEVGARLTASWLARWIRNPRKLRPDATMPALLDQAADPKQDAADLAAFLAAQRPSAAVRVPKAPPRKAPPQITPPGSDPSQRQGAALYESLGCLGCHRLTPSGEANPFARVSLYAVGEKYRAGALAAFLRAPQRHYRATRMPDFRLTEEEAVRLAAFLRNARAEPQPSRQVAPVMGDAARGKRLFTEHRCDHCHRLGSRGLASPHATKLTNGRGGGCLAERAPRSAPVPRFALTAAERSALKSFLDDPHRAAVAEPAVERAERLIAQLRCAACHDRDAARSPRALLTQEEGESGRPPEVLPRLTWAGEKLRGPWLLRMLERGAPARPWLKARMPSFPAYAQPLAHGLAAEHGLPFRPPAEPPPQPEKVRLGDRLTRKAGGLDCRQCHAVAGERPAGDDRTRLALGPDFGLLGERLRVGFYRRFVLDPPRWEPGTKMPRLAPDGRMTPVRVLFEGDARRQFDAIWQFIRSLQAAKDVP